jgi:hypothetical protein
MRTCSGRIANGCSTASAALSGWLCDKNAMKSLYTLTRELEEAVKMYQDCMKAWGIPNGWDVVRAQLEQELQEAQDITFADIPQAFTAWSVKDLVLEVQDLRGGVQGRFAELELFRRLKQRNVFTLQGPASYVYKEKGKLRVGSVSSHETFLGKFLVYQVGSLDG